MTTVEDTFLGVDVLMLAQIWWAHKHLGAETTFQTLLSGVDQHMSVQVSFLGEGLRTHATAKPLLPCNKDAEEMLQAEQLWNVRDNFSVLHRFTTTETTWSMWLPTANVSIFHLQKENRLWKLFSTAPQVPVLQPQLAHLYGASCACAGCCYLWMSYYSTDTCGASDPCGTVCVYWASTLMWISSRTSHTCVCEETCLGGCTWCAGWQIWCLGTACHTVGTEKGLLAAGPHLQDEMHCPVQNLLSATSECVQIQFQKASSHSGHILMCVCMCVRVCERERERETLWERGRGREAEG